MPGESVSKKEQKEDKSQAKSSNGGSTTTEMLKLKENPEIEITDSVKESNEENFEFKKKFEKEVPVGLVGLTKSDSV